jgi:hypothetical protein
MGFLLLGVDSLIALIAIGPIISRRWAVPLALLFGVGDGAGYLIGTAFHWSVPDNVSNILQTSILVVLGLYWIGVAIFSKRAALAEQQSKARWGVWVLPWALSIDNITYGLVDGVTKGASVWVSASEQALSSAIQARYRARDRYGARVRIPGGAAPHGAGQRNRRRRPDRRGRRPAVGRLTYQPCGPAPPILAGRAVAGPGSWAIRSAASHRCR